MNVDLEGVLAALAVQRPVFHSEPDFQRSLAWQIKLAHPQARIRLETRPKRGVHLDILIRLGGTRTAIEVKYLVAGMHATVGEEQWSGCSSRSWPSAAWSRPRSSPACPGCKSASRSPPVRRSTTRPPTRRGLPARALAGIARGIFDRTANLLNLSCDVIFVDTSSTYWEVDMADEEVELATATQAEKAKADAAGGEELAVPGELAWRQFSKHSKDHRQDLPQVVIAMAVTAEGVPVRCWTFPGTTSDQLVIRKVKDDLGAWMLNRVLWVTDSGFNSATNRAYLQRGGEHYIVCEKLRSASADAKKALARPGRYHLVEGNLQVKEVHAGEGTRSQRFVVCVNPEAKARDEIVRGNLVAYLEKRIAGSDEWSRQRRDELVGQLRSTPGVARFLRRTKDHKLRVDKAAIERDAHFDGKWLIRTSDDTLTPTDLAKAYKQLYQVERGWRDLKGALRLRPVFHHREDRIRAHIQLCWLAPLLVRVIENATGDTWRSVRHELDRTHLVTLETKEGRIAKRSATTKGQRDILTALELREPAQILEYELPTPAE